VVWRATAQWLFYKTQPLFALSKNVSWVSPSSSPSSSPNFSVSSTLCAFQERSRLPALFPGSFAFLGHPVCDCPCASPAKKSSKRHAFAVRQPPDPSLFFPSSAFFTNFFTTLFHLFRPFSLLSQ
jgi:hypothetical protein